MGVSIPHRRRARPPPELRIYGYDETTLARLERDFHLADLSSPTRIALDFARKLSRADPRPTPHRSVARDCILVGTALTDAIRCPPDGTRGSSGPSA